MGTLVDKCDCGYSHYGDTNWDAHYSWQQREIMKDQIAWEEHCAASNALVTLGTNLEQAASMAAMHAIGYTKGFTAGRLLAEFCEDYVPEPYFPIADSRPRAERLAWGTTPISCGPTGG